MLNAVSLSGTSSLLSQIGSGSVDTAGYSGQSVFLSAGSLSVGIAQTNGFGALAGNSANALSGHLVITHLGANVWVYSATLASVNNNATISAAGVKTLSGTLDRIRLTTVNGTDTFDAGSVNIMWE
jgi:hypothetical protein